MAFNTSIDISGSSGAIGRIFTNSLLTFADIFDGAPQYYPGSTILVQELLTINTIITTEHYVSADLRWFNKKRRLGSYQVGQITIGSPICDEDEGYLDYESQLIRRYSYYTITANPDVLIGQHEQISLDSCNLYLQPEVYLFPNTNTPVPGYRAYPLNPALLGSSTITRAPLADTEFFQMMRGVGLYLYPGVEGVSLEYKVQIVNDIYTDYNPAPVPECEFLTPSCDQEFAAFLANPNNNAYDTQALAEAAIGIPVCQAQYICTGGGFRQYWTFCST